MRFLAVALSLSLWALANAEKDNNFAPGRNTIVFLFEWKWKDVADECERFLADKGYAGIQVSPPNENVIVEGRPWLERYQSVSYNFTTRSGTEDEFADMVARCNAVGIRIYADSVLNHMTMANGIGTAGSVADYDGESYPGVPYSADDFHPICAVDDINDAENVRNCELSGLIDLDQSSPSVREKLVAFFDHLVDLGVAGMRIDLAKNMWPDDLGAIYSAVKNLSTEHGFAANSRPFIYQEVSDLDGGAVKKQEYVGVGAVLDFEYGNYLSEVFQGGDQLSKLETWGQPSQWNLLDGSDAVAFIDNHDNQRAPNTTILTYKIPKQYKMATAFMLAHPYRATTRVMCSFAFDEYLQGPPQDADGNLISPGIAANGSCTNGYVCEHRWRAIYSMVNFRNVVQGTEIESWWSSQDGQQIAFSRGNKGFVVFTQKGNIHASIPTLVPAGIYCDVISGEKSGLFCTGKIVVVDLFGNASVSLDEDEDEGFVAIHVNARIL